MNTFKRKAKVLLLILLNVLLCGSMFAQIQVTGTVSYTNDEPIIGATIRVKGTGTPTGTITDIDGKYKLEVAARTAILEFSYLGLQTQEVVVGDKTVINVVMNESARSLDEVVVVGYGVQKKVNVTGAISSINFEEQTGSRPITSVTSSLAGLSAGLNVMQSSGQPGADGATLRVRGVTTLNENSPLILIDGMQGSIDDLNPNDIASISILKDGASTAIYGARAGAGVILVTTKSGNREEKVTVNYSGRFSIMNPINLPKVVSNYADYMSIMNEAFANGGADPNFYKQEMIDLWREKSLDPHGISESGYPNYVAYPNTDWQKDSYNKNQILSQHDISVNGAGKNTRYLMSIGYSNNPGIMDYSAQERINMRVNVESDITKWLTLGTRTYGNKDKLGRLSYNAYNRWMMGGTPGVYPKHDGYYGGPEADGEYGSLNNSRQSLDGYANGKTDKLRINTTLYSVVKIMEGLSFTSNLNFNRLTQESNYWTSPKSKETYSFRKGSIITPKVPDDKLEAGNDKFDIYTYTLEHLLNYSKTFGSDHDVTALLGYQEYYQKQWKSGVKVQGFPDETIHNIGSATSVMGKPTSATYERGSRAIFGRATYAFKSRYMAEFNMRYDGHSRFHKNYRWGLFPSAAVGWRMSEESFMANTKDWLDNLKLRLSWGKSGNYGRGDVADDYIYQGGYVSSLYSFNNVQTGGLSQTKIANSSLEWETSNTVDFGFEANFLRQRLSFEFDAYQKVTDGILTQVKPAATAGVKDSPYVNLAELKNHGIEFTLGWNDKVGDVNYGVKGNFGYSTNKVSKYKGKLVEGWVEDANGNKVWKSNRDEVYQPAGNDEYGIIEGSLFQNYLLRQKYSGNQTYFDADGTVNPNGGPRDGMIRTEEDMAWLTAMRGAGYQFKSATDVTYGDYIYADINGDKMYGDENDRKFFGSSMNPKYTFGFQLYADWKGFDISANFAGAAGFDILWRRQHGFNSTTQLEIGNSISSDVAYNHYFYDPANPSDPRTNINAKYPRVSSSNTSSTSYYSDINLHKGDYLKLKNLTIGYTLPQNISNILLLSKLRVYFSGENLFSIDSFPGIDPEQGGAVGYQPIRQYAFGVNVTF